MRYILEFPPGQKLINANGRSSKYAVSVSSRFARAKVTAILKSTSNLLAKQAGIPVLDKVTVTGIYYPPDKRRRDSSNVLFFSVKAAVDGLVPRVLSDDNDKIVRSTAFIPGDRIVKNGQMVIILEEVE